ncbi:MAG: hypothetical protein MJ246_03530 [Clostridia bacterium]|nr:hypothetical protein [Clostridia bacterium]
MESKENGSYPTSIFLCGHSRGGAVSNILGTLLIDEGKYKVYDYTFGTPNTVEVTGVMTKSKIESYKEIFNHVNNDDFVTVLPCEA